MGQLDLSPIKGDAVNVHTALHDKTDDLLIFLSVAHDLTFMTIFHIHTRNRQIAAAKQRGGLDSRLYLFFSYHMFLL